MTEENRGNETVSGRDNGNSGQKGESGGGIFAPGPEDIELYCLNIEGTRHRWQEPEITTEEIAKVGGWDPGEGVQIINENNEARTLKPGEIVKLEPGLMFCKRVRFKRGLVREQRIKDEIDLLRERFPNLVQQGDWIRLPDFEYGPKWPRKQDELAFFIDTPYPSASPYGIYIPKRQASGNPENSGKPKHMPPFPGEWWMLSWQAEKWQPGSGVSDGANLVHWVMSFRERLDKGPK